MSLATALHSLIGRVAEESRRLGIPSISEQDGAALEALSFAYAAATPPGAEVLVVDAGAGIGYSALWLAAGLEGACAGRSCRLLVVERRSELAEKARRVLEAAPLERVEARVVEADALQLLDSMPPASIDIAFVDIDKPGYARALQLLASRLKPGGLAAFHNAVEPAPPRSFVEEALGWETRSLVPTPAGLLLLARRS